MRGTAQLAADELAQVVSQALPARSRRLGHASEAFTAQVYAHVLPQQGEQAAAAFAALVEGAR